jgi:hypothetical protein
MPALSIRDMGYRVTTELRPHYLHLHMEGPESYDAAMAFWRELAERATREGITSFLVVDTVVGRLNTVDHYEISEVIARLFAGRRIAYVDPKAETFEANYFGGTVINNRGGRTKVFRSEDEAHAWLELCYEAEQSARAR